MEITKIKIAGCEANMLFTGGQYIIWSDWYGVIGVANRKGYDEPDRHTFTIKAGTENTVGGSVNRSSIITAMKRYISKSENRYITHETFYEISDDILNCYIDIKVIDYQTKQEI